MNPLELIRFVEANVEGPQQLNVLARMADAPDDTFAPVMQLPVQNEIPAFRLGDKGLGSSLVNIDYGTAAPVPGQIQEVPKSLGELLIGEVDGNF